MKTIFYLLFVVAGLHAQQIAGKVVNSLNGEPVRRAVVIARAQDADHALSYATETDSHGQFAIGDMEPGTYLVSADHQGFHFQARGATGAPPPPLKLERDQKVQDLVLRLIPTGVIAGRVIDEDGDPVRGAEVEALVSTYGNGKKQLNPVDRVRSNDKGEYRMFGLTPGTFYIQASVQNMRGPQDMPVRGAHPPEKPAPAYYPGVSDEARAVPIEVAAGAELRGFDIRLSRQRAYSVHIKLPSKPDGSHFFYATVAGGRQAFSQGDVLDVVDLAPGPHVITVVQREGEKESYARVAVEIVDKDIEAGVQAFSPALDVSGVIRADDKKTHPWENIRVSLRPDGDAPNGPGSAANADGSFVLRNVRPGTYHLTVQLIRPVPDTYVKSASMGDQQLADWKLDLTKETAPLSILLGTDVATIEGTVKNAAGEPVVRARVNLIPYGNSSGRMDQTKFAFTDDQGEFNFKSVAPAQYRIFAWEDVEQGRPQDPAFRKRFEDQSVLVKMEPNGHEKVQVTAITAAAAKKAEP